MWEIEFRAWDRENKKMLYVPVWYFSLSVISMGMGKEGYDVGLNNVDITQYTGLKDKNNKKIFEGDIVSWGGANCTIEFINGCFTHQLGDLAIDNTSLAYCEVVGDNTITK